MTDQNIKIVILSDSPTYKRVMFFHEQTSPEIVLWFHKDWDQAPYISFVHHPVSCYTAAGAHAIQKLLGAAAAMAEEWAKNPPWTRSVTPVKEDAS